MLKFTEYAKRYGNTTVIHVPALELPKGKYWLKGENGSGKTTLIKSIAGLIPFDGSIKVAGNDIRKQRTAYTLKVNYAEAEPLYPAFLTGDDLISFYKSAKKGTDAQVKMLAQKMGVAAYSQNKTGTYSSGMMKKLSLLLAFVGEPELVLLDEPLITLDQHAAGILTELICEYHGKGVSFFITSHQQEYLDAIAPVQLRIENKTLVL